ncbi:MAG: glucose PTS transporter subunit IIA [Spirochaetales bacterium]|nr:glucose PTS transporter subunit IIA [Spirochaetales bacterium]
MCRIKGIDEGAELVMFFDKKILIEVCAPCAGKVVYLDNVPDPAFAERMVGDGVAIEPSEGKFYSPIEGQLEHLFNTKHAFSVSHGIAEILVHVGIESLKLEGEGFTVVKEMEEGTELTKNELLMEVDLATLKEKLPSLNTPVLIANYDDVQDFKVLVAEGSEVAAGDKIFQFSIRKK